MDYLLAQKKKKYFLKIHLELKNNIQEFHDSKLGYDGLIFALDCDYNLNIE